MKAYLTLIETISRMMNLIAGIALSFIMLLTVADVILRYFKMPIVGTFEIVGLGGAVVIGFGMPITSLSRTHIFVDNFVQKLSKTGENIVNVLTRLATIAIFVLIAYNLFKFSNKLLMSGEVTLTRQIPFYPIAFGLSFCSVVQCLIMIGDIFKIFGGQYE